MFSFVEYEPKAVSQISRITKADVGVIDQPVVEGRECKKHERQRDGGHCTEPSGHHERHAKPNTPSTAA
jgi:hypothetical protein